MIKNKFPLQIISGISCPINSSIITSFGSLSLKLFKTSFKKINEYVVKKNKMNNSALSEKKLYVK